MPVIEVSNLHKRYRDKIAVDDVSFTVEQGEIFGILGPNGAGKTTTVECVEGLRNPDRGTVRVLGLDPRRDRAELTQRLGVQLQAGELPDKMKVGEALELYGSFYRSPADWRRLANDLGIEEKLDTRFAKLSGGQKQRVSIALALLGNPEIAVLDELTTGLDPQARRDTWRLVEQVRDRGVTVVLVTHFMEEAERLCDRIAVIDAGRVAAIDTPAGLVSRVGPAQRIRFRPSPELEDRLLKDLPEVHTVIRSGTRSPSQGPVTCSRPSRPRSPATTSSPRNSGSSRATSTTRSSPSRAAPWRLRMIAKLTLMEFRLLAREYLVGLFVLALPVALLLGFGFQPGSDKAQASLGGQTGAAYIAAIGVGIALAILGLSVVPTALAGYREKGVLRRLATTPVRPAYVLVAQLIVNAALAVFVIAVLLVAGNLLFDTPMPRDFAAFAGSAVLGMAALFSIGLLVAAVAPSAKGGNAIGMVLFFPSLFLGGVYIPRETMPATLREIGDFSPLGATLKTMRDAWMGVDPRPAQLAIMAAYAVVAGVAAVELFRWE